MAEYQSVNKQKQIAMQKAWEINLAKSDMPDESKKQLIPKNPITYVGVKLKMEIDHQRPDDTFADGMADCYIEIRVYP